MSKQHRNFGKDIHQLNETYNEMLNGAHMFQSTGNPEAAADAMKEEDRPFSPNHGSQDKIPFEDNEDDKGIDHLKHALKLLGKSKLMKHLEEMEEDEAEEFNFKGGDIEHDWASHIKHPQFGESVKKVLHHSLTSAGIIEEYYVEHNGKLAKVLAEEVTVVQLNEHGGSGKKKKKK